MSGIYIILSRIQYQRTYLSSWVVGYRRTAIIISPLGISGLSLAARRSQLVSSRRSQNQLDARSAAWLSLWITLRRFLLGKAMCATPFHGIDPWALYTWLSSSRKPLHQETIQQECLHSCSILVYRLRLTASMLVVPWRFHPVSQNWCGLAAGYFCDFSSIRIRASRMSSPWVHYHIAIYRPCSTAVVYA